MEPILNSQLPEFSVQAFQNGAFKTVTNNDLKGKWAILFFYPADFTLAISSAILPVVSNSYSNKNYSYTKKKIKEAIFFSMKIGRAHV